MSVYGAMNAAVSGMKAQSRSLGNISDNIANSQTVGFKRVDTSFSEMVTNSNRKVHSPGGVLAAPRYRHSVQGDLTQTQIATNMGVSGNGFFVISRANSVTPQSVTFDDNLLYTRRGDFELDKFGFLRNGAGYYLNGRRVIDQDTLNTSDLMEPIRIKTDVMQANKTTSVNYSANLPANAPAVKNPYTTATVTDSTLGTGEQQSVFTFATSGSGKFGNGDVLSLEINGQLFEQKIVGTGAANAVQVADMTTAITALAAKIDAAAAAGQPLNGVIATPVAFAAGLPSTTLTVTSAASGVTFKNSNQQVLAGVDSLMTMASSTDGTFYQDKGSFSGGSVTVYNELGTPTDVQFRWLRVGTADTSPGKGEWVLMYQDPNRDSWYAVDTDTTTAGTTDPFSFNASGNTTLGAVDIMVGPAGGQKVTLDFTGLQNQVQLTSYYADDISVYRLDQDGYQAGILSDVSINDYGYVVANYDNGRSRVVYQVPLATFSSANELGREDGGAFYRTPESGDPLINKSGAGGAGSIVGSATENSNVDIADEFTKMIVTQRAYSANSRTVRTADDMLEEVVNLKR